MSTTPPVDHAAEAARILADDDRQDYPVNQALRLGRAGVHALLALAASVRALRPAA